MGGAYNPFNLGLYTYSHFNPVRYTDPNGKFTIAGVVVGLAVTYAVLVAIVNSKPQKIGSGSHNDDGLGGASGGTTSGSGFLGKIKNFIFNENSEGQGEKPAGPASGTGVDGTPEASNGTKPETGNKELDDVLSGSKSSDGGQKGFTYPGSQEELKDKVKGIEGSKHTARPNGGTSTVLPDGTKVDTYPGRSSTGKPGWQVTKPGADRPSVKGDTNG